MSYDAKLFVMVVLHWTQTKSYDKTINYVGMHNRSGIFCKKSSLYFTEMEKQSPVVKFNCLFLI